jgi:hypothetical protein
MAWPLQPGKVTAADLNNAFYQLLANFGASAQVLTDETTTSATYTNLTTVGPSVTVSSTGSLALVLFSCMQYVSSEASFGSAMSFDISGATTLAASENYKLAATEGPVGEGAADGQWAVVPITPGSNTYTAKYRVGSNTITGHFINRRIWVFAP